MSWLASSISPPPRSRRRIIHPWRPNPERSCICSTLALRALFVTFFLAVISRDGTMDDRQTRGKGGRRGGDPISSRTDNYNSATTSSRLFGGGEATTSSSSYDKFTDFVGSENRDHRMQGVQKRQRENAIAVPGDEKGPGRDEQGGTYLARRVPENNKVRRVGFDCSRILDENGLVRYYWDFPFQDSDGNMNLRSRLTYFGMGWVGWGIPLASTLPKGFLNAGFVEGTDVVIGLSDLPRSRTNPGRYSIDGPSLADVNLLPDRAQTLREASVRQTRRRSEMTFTYVMNGAMSNPVNITGENTIVWAYGFSNALGLYRDRDSYRIDFGVCSETAAPTLVPTRVPTMTPTDDVYDCETVVDDNGLVKFSWVEPFRVGNNILLSARIVYSGLGWVGWAVPQSPDGDVEGSDAIIGIPSAPNSPTNPGKYSLDNWSLQGAELSPVIEQTLLNTLLTQSDEETTMVFTKILNETGANPVTYPGVMNTFLFAYGVSNELGFYRERGSFSTDFTCAPSSAPSVEPSVSTSPSISSPPSSASSVLTKPSR